MYDVEKLVSLVCEYFEAEEANKKYNLEVRESKGYLPDTCLWIPSLGGSEAYRLGEAGRAFPAAELEPGYRV